MYELTERLTQPVGDNVSCNASEHVKLRADESLRAKAKTRQKLPTSERAEAGVDDTGSAMVQKSRHQLSQLQLSKHNKKEIRRQQARHKPRESRKVAGGRDGEGQKG